MVSKILLDFCAFLWYCVYCKGGADMAQIIIAEIYSGEKYDVMSAAMVEYLKDGRPLEYDERT